LSVVFLLDFLHVLNLLRTKDEMNVEHFLCIIEANNSNDNQSTIINNAEDQIHQQVGREEIFRENL
jgi:hypothetical protein